jgi:engulfment and cell motility protein 1
MYSTQLKDLTAPILDFQNLAKLLARRWRDYAVDRKKKDCRKVLGLLQQAVSDSKEPIEKDHSPTEEDVPPSPPGDEESEFDWTKLGFQTNDPTNEINEMGFLGLLDFASFVQRDSEAYRKVSPTQTPFFPLL